MAGTPETVHEFMDKVRGLASSGARADLVFVCDIFQFVGEAIRDGFLASLRALLKPEGRLVVIEVRAARRGEPSVTSNALHPHPRPHIQAQTPRPSSIPRRGSEPT